MPLKLVVANKAYSSWSLRPWILLVHFKIPFEEVVIPMGEAGTRAEMLKYAPTASARRCTTARSPCGSCWRSSSISRNSIPEKAIWPKGKAARAHARSLASEMHAGFQALRSGMPDQLPPRPEGGRAQRRRSKADVARIEAAWARAREAFGKAGPFLFGRFSAADAMFAPVVNRFHAYAVPVAPATRAYMDAVMALPAWKAWIADGEAEPWRIEKYESA